MYISKNFDCTLAYCISFRFDEILVFVSIIWNSRKKTDRLPIYITTDLLNKLAVITGGSRGIGYAIAQKFSQNGAQCIVISKNSDKIAQAASKLNSEATVQKKHVGIACDLRNREEIENVCKACWIYSLSVLI